ncbi:MAG: type II toxin-antitoxin system prevent-host-death family antitoxin [Planctomycetia bacterium]|nr:type II toxin-antitoxin system prevent-host-death family antitoxin [Planctomycetia bacterium]
MSTVTIEEAQKELSSLIDSLQDGEEVLITRNTKPVARLVAEHKPHRMARKAGNCQGMAKIIADDEEHLEDFKEYME